MTMMNLFDKIEECFCEAVLTAETPQAREQATMSRDVIQAAMRHINDEALVKGAPGREPIDMIQDRMMGLAKATSLLLAVATTISIPGGDPERVKQYWALILKEATVSHKILNACAMAMLDNAVNKGSLSDEIIEVLGRIRARAAK